MEFIETTIFTRRLLDLMTDEGYRRLQTVLFNRPDLGRVISGTGGLRKLRWGISGRGKRGGVRVIYYHAHAREQLLLLLVYPKNERDDLSSSQKRTLRSIVEREYR
jgi:mRNA-degrading endonuclease RelE of RelBE toxin-antitoxin system